jgi:ankyrin repeat protein
MLASVFLVSFTVLAFEVSLTRVFSVLFNYHYVFVAVSGAVCGLGLGGFGWHLLGQREGVRGEPGWAALWFGALIPVSVSLLFGSSHLLAAHLWSAVIPLLPFVAAGAFLAGVFRERAEESGRLYHADLLGAGLAAVLILPLIGLSGALHLAFPLGALGALGAAFWALSRAERGLLLASAITSALLLASWPLSARHDFLRFCPLAGAPEPVAKAMLGGGPEPGQAWSILDSDWSAYARTDLVRYDSPEAGLYTLQLYTDGDNPSQMAPFTGDLRAMPMLRRELPFIGYDLSPRRSMLSIGPGAGRDFLWGMLAGFGEMDGVEINAAMAKMMDRYRGLNGDLYHRPGVRVAIEDGRSFVRRSRKRYDLINSTLTQTATALSTGHALVESYIHSEEAFADYYRHLTPDGRYTLVTQSGPTILRAAFTAIEVMKRQGLTPQQACRHLAVLGRLPSGPEEPETPYLYLLIWKRSPLTAADLAALRRATDTGPASAIFLPDEPGDDPLERVAAGRATPEEVYASGLVHKGERLNVRPATDDRPFFLDLSFGLSPVLTEFLLGSLAVAALFTGALLWRQRTGRARTGKWAAYFGALGLGFMLVEIPLIQKLILFLGHPTLSLAAILFCLLFGASLGSRLSQAWPESHLPRAVTLAAGGVCALVAAYTWALAPLLGTLLSLATGPKLLVLGVLLLPLGMALGIPFPSGVRLMSRAGRDHVPWMWGVNGLMSVVGSALAAAAAKVIGFSGCLLIAAAIYGSLILLVPRLSSLEERGPRPERKGRRPSRAPAPRSRNWAGAAAPVAAAAVLLLLTAWGGRGEPSALYQSALHGRGDAVSRLIARGASVNGRNARAFGWTPLHAAAFAGNLQAAQELLKHGAEAQLRATGGLGWGPLHEAAYAGQARIAELLIAHGAALDTTDDRGRTPLHAAAVTGTTEAARVLLGHGARVDARDAQGRTPLYWAALLDQARMARLLLTRGAEVESRDRSGLKWTPLYAAIFMGHPEVVELLLEAGAQANASDSQGWTPLHLAASLGRLAEVRCLLAHGAEIAVRNNHGETPLQLAAAQGHPEIAALLCGRGLKQ